MLRHDIPRGELVAESDCVSVDRTHGLLRRYLNEQTCVNCPCLPAHNVRSASAILFAILSVNDRRRHINTNGDGDPFEHRAFTTHRAKWWTNETLPASRKWSMELDCKCGGLSPWTLSAEEMKNAAVYSSFIRKEGVKGSHHLSLFHHFTMSSELRAS